MGIQSRFIIGDRSDAQRLAECDEPGDNWECFACNGLCNIKLASLFAILSGDASDAAIERAIERIVITTPGQGSPWVHAVPNDIRDKYAEIASVDDDEHAAICRALASTPELEGWSEEDVDALVRTVGDFADTARLTDKSLWLWMSR
jgi:hypothetical protein